MPRSAHLFEIIKATDVLLHQSRYDEAVIGSISMRMESLRRLLETDATEIDTLCAHKWDPYKQHTLVYTATVARNYELVEMFLDYGANPNIICGDYEFFNRNCLTHMCELGAWMSIPVVSLLIDRGATINAVMPSGGLTALHFACGHGNGNAECVRLLIENGADMLARENDGLTPLWYAVKRGRCQKTHPTQSTVDIVRTLVFYGANIHEINSIGQTLLHRAAAVWGISINMLLVQYLVDSGVQDYVDDNGMDAEDLALINAGNSHYHRQQARLFSEQLQAMFVEKNRMDKLNIIAHGYHRHNRPTEHHPSINENYEHSRLYSVGRDPLNMILKLAFH